ncbi:MAG TPA: hypothetical protein VNT03_11620 [Baekduia sp.]|nr:hypothetical protein [Baekduia sp.]
MTNSLIPELERELAAMVARQAVAPAARPARVRRSRRLSRRAALAFITLLLLLATAALAATGVIPVGAPVSDPPGARPPRPNEGLGTVVAGTAKVLPLRVADPDGGPPWGLRLTATSRGIGCLHVGRVVDGRLGALGTDDAFNNDGRFHPFPTGMQRLAGCAELDGAGQLFASSTIGALPAAAISDGACYPPHEITGDPTARICPAADVREIAFGALGPQARSITYTGEDGRDHVQRTGAPYGAFLIVLRHDPRSGDFGMSGGGALSLANTPITRVTWADGHSCAVTPRGFAGPCPIPGYKPRPVPRLTTADVRSPVRAHVERRPGHGRVVVIRFRARAAVTDGSSAYTITRRLHGAHTWGSGMTERNIRAGEIVEYVFYGPPRHGVYTGTITYTTGGPTGYLYGTGPQARRSLKLVVGHYTLRVR